MTGWRVGAIGRTRISLTLERVSSRDSRDLDVACGPIYTHRKEEAVLMPMSDDERPQPRICVFSFVASAGCEHGRRARRLQRGASYPLSVAARRHAARTA